MRIGIRLRTLAIAAATLVAAMPSLGRAQESSQRSVNALEPSKPDDPVVVVSITKLDRLMGDLSYMAGVLGQEQVAGMAQGAIMGFTSGIDRSRPIGIMGKLVDGAPAAIVFLPSSDIKRFLRVLEAQTGPADELDDGTLVIALGASLIYIRQQGDWAYAAQSPEMLEGLPEDPLPWLAGMDTAYDIGVRLNIQALPEDQREMVVSQIREGFESAMQAQPSDQAEQILQAGTQSIEQLEMVINETDVLQFGLAIEPANKQFKIEFAMTGAAGTELAEVYDGTKSIPSKFASVVQPTLAAYFHGASSLSPKGVEQNKASIAQVTDTFSSSLESIDGLSETDREELERFFDRLIEIGEDTLSEGKSDVGGMISLEDNQLNAVAGIFVSDGEKVANLAKDLAKKVENAGAGSELRFTFDASNYQGVVLHYVEVDIPAGQEQPRQIFGDTLRLTIGTGSDAVYLALGKQSESLLKGFIDSAKSDEVGNRPISQGQIRLLPILEFAQSLYGTDPGLAPIADALAPVIDALSRSPEVDRVRFVTDAIPQGSSTAIMIDEGIFRASGVAAAQGMQGGVPGGF